MCGVMPLMVQEVPRQARLYGNTMERLISISARTNQDKRSLKVDAEKEAQSRKNVLKTY
jgi:hypothetical protein